MRQILLLAFVLIFSASVFGQWGKNRKVAGYKKQDYEITCAGVGVEGTKLVKVYGYARNVARATYYAKLNAIRGVIFRGAPGSTGGCQGIQPLAKSPDLEEEEKQYFNDFFAPGGPYLSYVAVSDQEKSQRDVAKIARKTYKVGMSLAISYDALRKKLESDGIIRGLDSGF